MALPENGKFLAKTGLVHLISLIKTSLLQEAIARENADATLSGRVGSLETFKDTTVPATYATKTELSTETTNRSNADTTLQTNIDNEAQTRLTNDNALYGDISAEATARETKDTELTNTLNTEIQDRKDAVNAEATARGNADSTLTTNLNKEIQDRVDAINGEITARSDADSALSGRITNLETFKDTTVPATYATKTELTTNVATLQASIDTKQDKIVGLTTKVLSITDSGITTNYNVLVVE